MDGWLGIIGVVVGFALGALYQGFREWNRRRLLRRQLQDELKANLYVIPQKRATIKSILDALAKKRILPGESVPFCTAIFGTHYAEVAPFLSQKQRNLLQVVYSNLDTVDKTMAEFEPAVTAANPGDGEARVMTAFGHKLNDLLGALDAQEQMIQSYLAGAPLDVFHMELPYEELKAAKITKD